MAIILTRSLKNNIKPHRPGRAEGNYVKNVGDFLTSTITDINDYDILVERAHMATISNMIIEIIDCEVITFGGVDIICAAEKVSGLSRMHERAKANRVIPKAFNNFLCVHRNFMVNFPT